MKNYSTDYIAYKEEGKQRLYLIRALPYEHDDKYNVEEGIR